MNLLITGGLGYLGLEICHAIAGQAGIRIFTMGRSANSTIALPANVQHIQGSILDYQSCAKIINDHHITHLVHAAGVRTSTCENDPLAGVTGNVIGTENIFRAAAESETIEHAILISTAAVYGQRTEKVDETCPVSPGNRYALTKAASELAAIGHAENDGFPLQIVRPGFVIGTGKSGSKPMGSLNQLIIDAWAGNAHSVSISPKFFVQSAADLGADITRLITSGLQDRGEVFHMPGWNYTAEDLVEDLRRTVRDAGCQCPEIELCLDPNLPVPYALDFSKYEQRLGTSAQTPLDQVFREFRAD